MTREMIQKLTDDFAKTLKTRKQPAAIPAGESFAAEKQETAFNDLRILTVKSSVQNSIKQFVLKRNNEAQKKKEKAKQNKMSSSPFWF
jgi:hypothetical protein